MMFPHTVGGLTKLSGLNKRAHVENGTRTVGDRPRGSARFKICGRGVLKLRPVFETLVNNGLCRNSCFPNSGKPFFVFE